MERRDSAKHLKTKRALYSADQRRTALPAGVTCLLTADAAGIVLRLGTFLRLGPGTVLLRHPNAAAEWQPYAAAVIAIDVTNVASMVLTAAFLILIANAIASRTLPCDSAAVPESTPLCAIVRRNVDDH